MSCEVKIYKNDIGTKIKLWCGQDVSTATVIKIKYKKPDASEDEWIAVVEDDEYIYYITQSGNLDQKGVWKLQAYIELPSGWKGLGETVEMTVYDKFE